ncbi:MAG: AtpZ/AtpI family protein [Alphaproteobacteria bacterium]|nr:AtpZ/AtpI family protein [Alphaproteobacteria bacterium]MBP7757654.1 AtpZ/AtpI family protein [Alphaproteobacteria bacterium]MBP7761146.1 AtpZ/AtpI family protein [Alphaproteobacteria bacterium]MBP7904793.1 AtpZ/AtpI family protein [Alphaproteobacteria bacterium]
MSTNGPDNQDFEARLREAKSEFEKMEIQAGNKGPEEPSEGAIRSGHAGAEFLANVFAGAIVGYLIDSFAGTRPWGMIGMMVLGFVSGVIRANAAMRENNKKNAGKP